MSSCKTRLIVVDDVHFLDMNRRDGREVANHFKWLSNQFPVTFAFVGVRLRQRHLLNEGLTAGDRQFAQTARRWTRLTLTRSRSEQRRGAATGVACCWPSSATWSWPTPHREQHQPGGERPDDDGDQAAGAPGDAEDRVARSALGWRMGPKVGAASLGRCSSGSRADVGSRWPRGRLYKGHQGCACAPLAVGSATARGSPALTTHFDRPR